MYEGWGEKKTAGGSGVKSVRLSLEILRGEEKPIMVYEEVYEKETKIATLHPFILFNKHEKYSFELWLL